MSNQWIKNNGDNGTETTNCESVAPGMQGLLDPASAGRHQATDQTKENMKCEKAVNKIVTECWIRSEPLKRKYTQRMKKIWDEIGVFPVTEQSLADQARQLWTNKWLTEKTVKWKFRRMNRKKLNTKQISRVSRKSKGHKRPWLNKDIRMSSSGKHTTSTFVHFQKMMKY